MRRGRKDGMGDEVKGGMANKRGEASSRGLDCPGERVLSILGGIWSTLASLSIHSLYSLNPPPPPVRTLSRTIRR